MKSLLARLAKAGTIFLAMASTASAQQAWPAKPVKVYVGYPAGGLADVMARSVAQLMSETLGQPVVVDNKPGANGNLAGEFIAKQPADGYSLCLCSTVIESVNPFLYEKMGFDPLADVRPAAATGRIQAFLVTKPDFPASKVADFVAHAKASSVPLTYGSAGAGSSPHLLAEMFKRSANFKATHIPYKGAAPAIQDLLAGHVNFMFDPGLSLPHVKAGRLKAYAVVSGSRSALLPDTPTLTELGFPGLDYDTWFALYVRSGTPQAIVNRINEAVNRALADPSLKARYRELGAEPVPMSAADIKAIAQRERAAFGPVIRELAIKAD
ncbi:Bug family tripartite tricarboxylate transporter substrate binding protein [Ottowia sp. VDI28]|uniref:Bug family tripartite tricarboxylate transporter substrate binding protein n=1 Tax=Ottowia sp. VDI28 TaxID=3133968 RepID=UPI003C2BD78E